MDGTGAVRGAVWLTRETPSLDAFRALVEDELRAEDVPLAAAVERNVAVYDGDRVRAVAGEGGEGLAALTAEWAWNLLHGSGVLAVRRAETDHAMLDRVTAVFEGIIGDEAAGGAGKGDHFAPSGANSRVWNAHEKLGAAAPELFARYYAGDVLHAVSRAWLGPAYQITAQVNVVRPGGRAQTCHRDYHLGFMDEGQLLGFPAHVHRLSPLLTLQGAMAHSDMPLPSGPTKLLPFSQRDEAGYVATLMPAFRDYFEERHVQLPLEKGDALFFNPALFHAAGTNTTRDVQRFANLFQVGSALGRSIETVDRRRLAEAVFPALRALQGSGALDARGVANVVAAAAEGYAFPTNLDLDVPEGALIPPSGQDLMSRALAEGWDDARFREAMAAQAARRRSHEGAA